MTKSIKVYLTLKPRKEAAREVAENVMMRANPHSSVLTEQELTSNGITVENMQKYFLEIAKAVVQFWNSNWDPSVITVMKPHEMRQLYLPLVYGVIFASVGNMTLGNYEYLLKAQDDEIPDRKFLIEFSAKLESMRHHVKGSIGQIGNRQAQPQTSTMMTILANATAREAEVNVRDGINIDHALGGLAALAGVSLVEEAYKILYTGVEQVNFRQVTETLIDKGLQASRTSGNDE